jgi:hypothetical protein
VELEVAGEPGSYELRSRTSQATARIDYAGSAGTEFQGYRGSLSPFAGWHVVDSTPKPAPAIVVEQPAGDAWLAAVVSRTSGASDSGPVIGRPLASRVSSAEEWSLTLPTASGQLEIQRSGDSIAVSRPDRAGDPSGQRGLVSGPDVTT